MLSFLPEVGPQPGAKSKATICKDLTLLSLRSDWLILQPNVALFPNHPLNFVSDGQTLRGQPPLTLNPQVIVFDPI